MDDSKELRQRDGQSAKRTGQQIGTKEVRGQGNTRPGWAKKGGCLEKEKWMGPGGCLQKAKRVGPGGWIQ